MTRMDDLPTLPHYLRPGLRVVFVGYNPGIESATLGHYYAKRGNAFWPHLNQSGLVDRTVGYTDDALLMNEAGIGFTDLCPLPSSRADELTGDELRAGARALCGELLANEPEVVVLSGRKLFDVFAKETWGLDARALRGRAFGPQPERIGPRTKVWMIPNSSGLASGLHGRRLELLKQLAAELSAAGSPRS